MAHDDVPGFKPENRDTLAMGCWAEHEDGSLILVESTEGGRVIYLIFDVSGLKKRPPRPLVEFRDAMPEAAFKREFSWSAGRTKDKWTWHDKTAFPWDRVIEMGATDGVRHASADDQISAAERVRRSREIHSGREVTDDELRSRIDRLEADQQGIVRQVQNAISKLRRGKGTR